MEGNNLEVSTKEPADPPQATYKQIPESDMEEEAMSRPKNLVKSASESKSCEADGADEKMLPDGKKTSPNSAIGMADVKFTINEKQNGDAKLDIGELKSGFVGMGKDELMKYANDPFWVRLRWFLFVTFWLLWAAMLIGAIMIIYAAPKCEPPKPRAWWEEGPLTEVEISVQTDKLKLLKQKGIQGIIAVWPEDTYASYNTSSDFADLLSRANETGINVIVELNPSHSTIWFEQSQNGDENFNNYYIWKKPKTFNTTGYPEPPNNWLANTNDPAWAYSQTKKEYYYSPRGKPHLNFRNPEVIQKFINVIENFLQKGVKGINLRDTPYLFVSGNFENEDVNKFVVGHFLHEYKFYLHTKTSYLPEIGPVIKKWREVTKASSESAVFMLAEETVKLDPYTVNNTLYVDLPRISNVFSAKNISASKIMNGLKPTNLIDIIWPLWEHKNEELPADVLDTVTYLLPGTVLIDSNSAVPKQLLEIRKSQSIMYGLTKHYELANSTVFAFIRVASGNPGILVGMNPTNETVTVDFTKEIPGVSEDVTVKYKSQNYNITGIEVKKKIKAHSILMSPQSAIVLSYVPKSEE